MDIIRQKELRENLGTLVMAQKIGICTAGTRASGWRLEEDYSSCSERVQRKCSASGSDVGHRVRVAINDVDDDCTLTPLSPPQTLFLDSEVEMQELFGVLDTTVEDVVKFG